MAKWLSISNGGLGETGLRDMGNAFQGKALLSSLVRESVQNSLDAKRDDAKTVSMEFCYQKVNANEVPNVFRLRQIFNFCKQFVTSKQEKEFFENGGNKTLYGGSGEKSLGILRISDHGTIGLTGLTNYSENGRFRGLVTRMGMGNDDASRGGNFGVGKQALFLASKVRTVFFSSIDGETGAAGHMGVAKLSSFRDPQLGNGLDGKPLCADRTVYYCNESYNPATQSGNPVIDGQFKFGKRLVGDFGTDVFIMGFDPKNEDKFSVEILTVLLSEFIVAVDEGRLEVTLPDGFTLSKKSIDQAFEKFQNGSPGKADRRKVTSYIDLVKQPWKSSPVLPVGAGMPSFPAGAIEYKFVKSDEDNFCRVTREKGMFVHTLKKVCGNANCVGIAAIRDKELNAAFKGMENEAHDTFEVTDARFPDDTQRTLAEAQLKVLEGYLKQCANDEVGAKIEGKTIAVLPDEMEELMDICAGQVSVADVKGKSNNRSVKLAGTRVRRIKHKPKPAVQAETAGLSEEGDADEQDTGIIQTGAKTNKRKHANPGGKRNLSTTSPEANGYAMRSLDIAPFVYASDTAASGRYRVTFTVPRNKAKVCLCFSATTEADSQERLDVKSVSATDASGNPVIGTVDLDGTAVAFENVTKGQTITAEVEFDISYYCYSQVRYYEKKNN